MDANGLRFWTLSDERHWQPVIEGTHARVRYDTKCRRVRLASERTRPAIVTDRSVARQRLDRLPVVLDDLGGRAFWNATDSQVYAAGNLPGSSAIFRPPLAGDPADLTVDPEGILYLAFKSGIVMRDSRNRWDPHILPTQAFEPQRLAPHRDGGVWALDTRNQQVGRVTGRPLHKRAFREYAPDVVRPCEENDHPPALSRVSSIAKPGYEFVAIACSPAGRLALLAWRVDAPAEVLILDPEGIPVQVTTLEGADSPYSVRWINDSKLAVLLVDQQECLVYVIDPGVASAAATGEFYSLKDHDGVPFVQHPSFPPHYGLNGNLTQPLLPISLPSFPASGVAVNAEPINSGGFQTIWHRLYVEAVVPPNCGILIDLATSQDGNEPAANSDSWFPHGLGSVPLPKGAPSAAWCSEPSELPYHPGLLAAPQQRNRSGLFTVLIQRAGRKVRALRGSFLHVRVRLYGDGRTTPEIAAVRVYSSRFSYAEHYLPELYHETIYGDEADEVSPQSTRADFLERFLDTFESILTPLEGRIADSYLVTDPHTTPEEALEWLGSWIGVLADNGVPKHLQRELIASAPRLFRARGTLEGLTLALELATGGSISGGEIVILEEFRLRRTFATILGADLADEDDPLLGGLVHSGNSFVGDTLFLGDEHHKEFLALFSDDLAKTKAERDAVNLLFSRLAHRVLILVHSEVEPQNRRLIERIVELEKPAHVVARVENASTPFLVGAASLVGIDTYLAPRSGPKPVRIGSSQLGMRDLILGTGGLDPRRESGYYSSGRPVARTTPETVVDQGNSFTLDGSESTAPSGRTVKRFLWTLKEKPPIEGEQT